MMFNFPFYPYHHSRFYNYYPYKQYNSSQKHTKKNTVYARNRNDEKKNISLPKNEINNDIKEDFVLNVLGLKLYYDDILLICLIFFLYNEGIQDETLFIILILLLIS